VGVHVDAAEKTGKGRSKFWATRDWARGIWPVASNTGHSPPQEKRFLFKQAGFRDKAIEWGHARNSSPPGCAGGTDVRAKEISFLVGEKWSRRRASRRFSRRPAPASHSCFLPCGEIPKKGLLNG